MIVCLGEAKLRRWMETLCAASLLMPHQHATKRVLTLEDEFSLADASSAILPPPC
jgi:hypothetical protein